MTAVSTTPAPTVPLLRDVEVLDAFAQYDGGGTLQINRTRRVETIASFWSQNLPDESWGGVVVNLVSDTDGTPQDYVTLLDDDSTLSRLQTIERAITALTAAREALSR